MDGYDVFLHGAQAVLTVENPLAETDRELGKREQAETYISVQVRSLTARTASPRPCLNTMQMQMPTAAN